MKKKAVLLLGALFLLLGAACVSLGRVSQGEEYVAAAGAQSLYRLDIAQARGTIYDCNLQPLVGGETQYVAAVAPTIQSIGALEKATDGEYRDRLALALENGRPFQLVLESPVDDPRIDVFQVPQRYTENQLAPHIIGYLDSLGGGAAGIELAMDDVLRQYEERFPSRTRWTHWGGPSPEGSGRWWTPWRTPREGWPSPWTARSKPWPRRRPKGWAKGQWWSPRRRIARSGRWPVCRISPPWTWAAPPRARTPLW